MFHTFLLLALSSLATFFLGYWLHRAFHCSWSGPFFKAHSDHHNKQYPPDDFISDTYRDSGKNNTIYYFIVAFLPIIIMVVGSVFVFGVSVWSCICVLVGMFSTGILHDRLHDAFHLNKTYWQHLPWYAKWQELHLRHHQNQKVNYGIFSFTLDKMFKTFEK